MLDLSFAEILVVLIVALVVLGPEKLPKFARFIGSTINKLKFFGQKIQQEIMHPDTNQETLNFGKSIKNSVTDLTAQVKKDLDQFKDNLPHIDEPADDHHNFLDESFSVAKRPSIKSNLDIKYRKNKRKTYKQNIGLNHKNKKSLKHKATLK